MTSTRAQQARTRKAHLTAHLGPDHPQTRQASTELSVARVAAAIIREQETGQKYQWTDKDRRWLHELIDGTAIRGNTL